MDEEDRSEQVRAALIKAVTLVVVLGVVIALGTVFVVRAFGLNESDSSGPVSTEPSGPGRTLPTTALPVPGEQGEESEPTEEPSASASASPTEEATTGKIVLRVSPVAARPSERINLTGTYKGADSQGLQVQRFEEGEWRNFGVDATVRAGTYATYVTTGRAGEQRFRMFDPVTQQSSNVELVTVG